MEELSYVGKTISDFLSTLAADANNERIFDSLYSDGPTVRVILREALPPVAQQFVMRLAFGGARPFQEAALFIFGFYERIFFVSFIFISFRSEILPWSGFKWGNLSEMVP